MRSEVHLLGVFVHGMLTSLHALGVVYNLRRGNRFDVTAHALAGAYSLKATFHHVTAAREVAA